MNTIVLMLGLSLPMTICGATADQSISNRYGVITARNAFGLKPLPTPVKADTSPQALLNVEFTGVTVLNGVKQAFFKITDLRLPRGHPKATWYSCITEGKREGLIEVLRVDEKAGIVRIRNAGIESVLTFAKNGLKPNPITNPAGKLNISPATRIRPYVAVPYRR